MAKRTTPAFKSGKAGKKPSANNVDDSGDWDDSDTDYEESWLQSASRDKERSRIQRQMKARRELERRREEKHLQELVADWPF